MIVMVNLIEMTQYGLLLPFVYFMVRDFGIASDTRQIGYYAGLITSSFCIAQFLTSLPWSWVSDRCGNFQFYQFIELVRKKACYSN